MADYFDELLKDSPVGAMKLLAAWDSLTTETQIELLKEMTDKRLRKRHHDPIWLRALSNPSAYIRYLAAKEIGSNRNREINNKIISDPNPLVRYSLHTGDITCTEDFDRYSREQKLGVVSYEIPPDPTKIAAWIGHAIENKSTAEDEVYDVIFEYLSNPETRRRLEESAYDFFADREQESGFNALWCLVPKAPGSIAQCLVGHLPWSGLSSPEPPSEVLTWIEGSPYLDSLLWREDVPLVELRRKIFFSSDPKNDAVKTGAVLHHFFLTPDELHGLFNQNSELLNTLTMFCDFSPSNSPLPFFQPVMVQALRDYIWAPGSHVRASEEERLEGKFRSSLAELKKSDKEQAFRLLRIYRLAENVIGSFGSRALSGKNEPALEAIPESVRLQSRGRGVSLADEVVEGDWWGTFLAFAKQIDWRLDRYDEVLPNLTERDLPEERPPADEVKPQTASPGKAVEAPAPQRSPIAKALLAFGIVAALITILFAVGGILDNANRNFNSGVIAMALSAGVIVLAASDLIRRNAA